MKFLKDLKKSDGINIELFLDNLCYQFHSQLKSEFKKENSKMPDKNNFKRNLNID